jgi:Ceramidase
MQQGQWPVFLYCERTAVGLLGEPLNTLSNIAFIVAAWLCFREWKRRGDGDKTTLWLIMLVVVIGLGSAAFHAMPNRITLLMDVVPIGIFVLSCFGLAVWRHFGLPWWAGAGAAAAFAGLSPIVSGWAAGVLPRGGAGYAPALIAMPLIALAIAVRLPRLEPRARLRGTSAMWAILAATAVFAVSLTARTLDRPMCGTFPAGLHAIWHVLNAVVLLLLTRAHMRNRA